MADKTIRQWNRKGNDWVDVLYHDNGDGTYSQSALELRSNLKLGAKSLALTLSTGAGSVLIPDTCSIVGVRPVVSTTIRVGLEAPEADGTKTGDAIVTDLKKGVPVDALIWTWFKIDTGVSRVLYVKGGASDVVEVVVL